MKYQIRHPQNIQEISNVFDMLKECFPKTGRGYFVKRILGDPNYHKRHAYLLTKDNSFISHVHLFKKKIYYYGKQLPVIGLGAICTLPEYRNRGYCKALLRKVIQSIRGNHAPFIILFTRVPRVYERLGFSKITERYYLLEKKREKEEKLLGRKGLRIRKFNFNKDILSVMRIYEDSFKCHFGPAVRGFKDWLLQLSYFNEDKKLFLVLEDNKEIKAYIRCKRTKMINPKIINVVEIASGSEDNGFLIYLLKYLFKITGADYLKIDSRLSRAALSVFFKVKVKDDFLLMYRFTKRDKEINRLKMKEMLFLESDAF